MANTKHDKILYQRIPTPRPPPKVVLKEAWQVQHEKETQQQTGIVKSIAGQENPFNIDFRVQGVPQKAVLENRGRKVEERQKREGQQKANTILVTTSFIGPPRDGKISVNFFF